MDGSCYTADLQVDYLYLLSALELIVSAIYAHCEDALLFAHVRHSYEGLETALAEPQVLHSFIHHLFSIL